MEGLRGVAVLLVFLVHFYSLFEHYVTPGSALHWLSHCAASLGHSGVDLFFILSGYLIFGGHIRSAPPFGRYMRRRAERIYPTFLVVLAVYVGLSFVMPGAQKLPSAPRDAALYLAANVLLLPGMFHIDPILTVAWSLSYEWFFYLFVPALVALTRMRTWTPAERIRLFTVLAALHLALSFVFIDLHPRLAMFFVGMVLYERIGALRDAPPVEPGVTGKVLARLAVTVAVIAAVVPFYPTQRWPGALSEMLENGIHGGSLRVALLAWSLYPFVHTALGSRGPLTDALSWRPLRALGNMSYSYYLIHGLALHALSFVASRVFHGRNVALFIALFPAGLAATLVASAALYLAVEKPLSLSAAPKPGAARLSASGS